MNSVKCSANSFANNNFVVFLHNVLRSGTQSSGIQSSGIQSSGIQSSFRLCLALLAMTSLFVHTGCALINPAEPAEPVVVSESDSLVALDFVNIMLQIETLSPGSTVLRFGLEEGNASENDARSIKSSNAFGKALRAVAIKNGYALETVGTPSGDNYVSYAIAEFGDAVHGTTYTYDVSVGDIDLRRVYKPLENGGIEPVKSMLVRGADVSQLETDDSIFARSARDNTSVSQTSEPALEATASNSDTEQLSTSGPIDSDASVSQPDTNEAAEDVAQSGIAVFERPVTIAAPLISDLPGQTLEDSLEASGQGTVDGDLATGFETIRKINIAVSGESNYESLLADKEDVAAEVLIFGDDSYVLGNRNKQILTNMMQKFNSDTDVVSVVGCSTGVTKIKNGNAALAIGRANRVKEALLYSGVPQDKIYDEGCWSPTANSTPFPNRGVVVTVKRQVGNG